MAVGILVALACGLLRRHVLVLGAELRVTIDGAELVPADPAMLLIALRLNEKPCQAWRDRFLLRAHRAYKRGRMSLVFHMGNEGPELRVLAPRTDANHALEAVESAMDEANLAPSET
ncbi:MAG: hypothetical protein ACYTKD_07315 [Planctomycetota bacterium]